MQADADCNTPLPGGEAGHESVHAAIADTVAAVRAAASIMRSLASAQISCGDEIDGCALDWLGQQIDAAANRAADALDELRRGARA